MPSGDAPLWFTSDSYPTTIPYEMVTFPVQRFGSRAILSMRMLEELARQSSLDSKSDLWPLQQAVFEARMEALKHIIRTGHHPVDEARISVDIRVEQRAVSDEAGDIDHLPEDMHYVTAYLSGGLYD